MIKNHKKDLILIALALLAALALYLVSRMAPAGDITSVVVTVDGKEVLRRPLAINAEYTVPNAQGKHNVICVQNGEVFMKEANCRDGLCLQQGRMKNTAKTIVCLPNRVVVTLSGNAQTGGADSDIDVIIQ